MIKINNKEQAIEILCNDEKLAKAKKIEINYEQGVTAIIIEDQEKVCICQEDCYISEKTLEEIITDLCFKGGLSIYGETFKFINMITTI